ncbi:MAG: diguanylate cyclase [Tatlockia sp.]|nr:diguanylate cyclase [Tatlockia sp.]
MKVTAIMPPESKNFCDNIKLSEFNQIQSHGGLLVLNKNLEVIQYSENVMNLLDITLEELLNSPVTAFLDAENKNENIANWLIQKNNTYKRINWKSPRKTIKIWVYAHQAPEGVILEIEPLIENDIDNSLLELMQYVIDGMKITTSSQSMQQLLQNTCNEIHQITGFDRVMAYQFDKLDDSGVVIAEVITNKMESYLGLHFPATDIPQNVRAMYLNMPIRYIPSINYKLEKILPEKNPLTKTYLDLSNTALRMVAPIHLQYLENMGVMSAVSIAIIHNNKLWGLIACHHKKPKYLSVYLRLILMLIGKTLGIQVTSLDCSKEYLIEQRTAELLSSLTKNISKKESLLSALNCYHKNIMELVGTTGMSIYYQRTLLSYGETPSREEVMALIEWLKDHTQSSFSTHSLPSLYKPSVNYKDKACGLLVIPITSLQNHYMIFYRPELINSIYWAGNPSGSLKCHGNKYSPRDSFERFIQTFTDQAAPWTSHEVKAAEFIRSIVVNKQLQELLKVQAMHDPLTDLLNRLYLDQRLEVELNRAKRKSQQLTFILVDLDLFKKINDNFGHQAGDYLLTEFAKFMKNCFRGYDDIYRYGGEEFLILLPDTNGDAALKKAEILRTEIKQLKLKYRGKVLPAISISAGIAVYPDNGTDGRSLIAAADIALYKAKSSGRDKIVSALTH